MNKNMLTRARSILRVILRLLPSGEREALLDQVDQLRSCTGPVTMLELVVAPHAIKSQLPDGLVPVRAIVNSVNGRTVGELMVWVETGVLSTLEFAWWSDEPPRDLPDVEEVEIVRSSTPGE